MELIKLLIEGGFSGVIIFMLYDMRRESKAQREEIWRLVTYLVERQYPGVDAQAIATNRHQRPSDSGD